MLYKLFTFMLPGWYRDLGTRENSVTPAVKTCRLVVFYSFLSKSLLARRKKIKKSLPVNFSLIHLKKHSV